mmetsp:Transcript_117213/g.332141  ORF Transcript_117213/g.332141 Transcript_117213/m.332141 type:complete len:154 (+) Transcript_117213:230-691(+)
MKPAWDKLGAAFKDSTSVLIADVDCTSDEGKAACEANGVKGFPTIKYFNETNGKEGANYEGGRDFKSLKKFVKKTLGGMERKCDVKTKDGCLPDEVEVLVKWEDKPTAERDARAKLLAKKLSETLKGDQRKAFEHEAKVLAMMAKGADKKEDL